MLASFLPGLREVRTPLVVGYLWLLFGWCLWSDRIPARPVSGDDMVVRLYQLSDLLPNAAFITSISFAAYVVGALLSVPVEGRLTEYFVRLPTAVRVPAWMSYGQAQDGWTDYSTFVLDRDSQLQRQYSWEPKVGSYEERERNAAISAGLEQLRPRLLMSGHPEMYSEYDRFVAEASFRINIAPPLTALGLLAGLSIAWPFAPVGIAIAFALLVQGSNRITTSVVTIRRAVTIGVFIHPIEDFYQRHAPSSAATPP